MNSNELPVFTTEQFALANPPECDLIMKGGITSGIVYPYALLELATKYRFRSVGGTSAGAIAAAFAAAAEYARQNGRPEGFMLLKHYCDNLPETLLSLFQPSPELLPAVDSVKKAIHLGSFTTILTDGLRRATLWAAPTALAVGGASYLYQPQFYSAALAAVLGLIVGGIFGLYRWAMLTYAQPLVAAAKELPQNGFGFCTGLTQPGSDRPAVTDWIHQAIQHIAFGDPDATKPLTFGDLRGNDPLRPNIDLQVVTTNLSMRRPHTLPKLGVAAGFMPDEWQKLFPKPVMDYMFSATKKWQRFKGAWLFPQEQDLPVIIAVRMSLSFPLLFSSIPLKIEDTELPSIVKSLGGKPYKRIRTALFSDGGISSNFPVHMFDRWLPERPTFAFSLEDLLWDPAELKTRVTLPSTASEGMGVQIKEIKSVRDFAWQILNSAKDWQDQMLSEISGQRERVVRIFLSSDEGGINLDMKPEVSRKLMQWGHDAGRKFNDGTFDFDEHKWRRLLVIYKHLQQNLRAMDSIWIGGFSTWYDGYSTKSDSYDRLNQNERRAIAKDIARLLKAYRLEGDSIAFDRIDERLPRRSGSLKIGPRY